MSERPHILMVSVQHQLKDDRIYYKQARSLARLGWQVTILAVAKDGMSDPDPHIDFITLPHPRGVAGLLKKFYAGSFYRRMKSLGVETRPDIVLAHEPQSVHIAKSIADVCGAPMIFDSHESFRFSNPKDKWALRHHIPKVRHYLAVNELVAEDIRAVRSDAEVCIVRNCSLFTPIAPVQREKLTIVHEGHLTYDRGLILMLDAAEKLLSQRPDIAWRIVGAPKGPEADYLNSRMAASEALAKIEVTGWLPYEQVAAALQDASIGLILNEPTPNNRYSSPNKLFNYLAMGLSVVSVDLPFVRSLLSQYGCGNILNRRSPDALYDLLLRLIDDPDTLFADRMTAHTASIALTWDKEAMRLNEFLSQLLQSDRRSE